MTIPRRLQAVIKHNNGKYHRIAAELGVNVFWVHALITKAKEPRNPDIRKRMYLPPLRKPKSQSTSGQKSELPNHIHWWRSLPKEVRSNIVRDAWIHFSSLHLPEKPSSEP